MIKIIKKSKKNVNINNEISHNNNNQSEIININTNIFYSFKLYGFILYDNEGKIILSSLKWSTNNNSDNESKNIFNNLDIYSSLIKKIIILNKTSKIKNKINFIQIYFQKQKLIILNFFQINLYLIGFFSNDTTLSIIRLLMLNIYISLLNYLGENSSYITNDDIKSEIKKNSCNEPTNKNNNIVYSDTLFSKIYESFILYPLIKFFIIITENIFMRQPAFFEESKFKNFLLLNTENNKIIFSYEKLYNQDNILTSKNIKINEIIWKEILYHGQQLKQSYYNQYKNLFDINEYQNYYVKIEFCSTFPRIAYIIKFLPILNGLLLIYEYENEKLARCEDEDLRKYKEIEIIDGCFLYEDERYRDFLSFESRITKERDFFLINFLMCVLSNVDYLYYCKDFKLKYFSREIFSIIDDKLNTNINQNNNINVDVLIKEIFNKLYDEYLLNNNKQQEISGEDFNLNKKHQNEKFSFLDDCSINEYRNDNEDSFLNWIDFNSNYMKKLYQINKMFILKSLFSNVKDLNTFDVTMNLSKIDEDISRIIKNTYSKNINNQTEKFNISELLDDKYSNYSKDTNKKLWNSTIFKNVKLGEKHLHNVDNKLNNSSNLFLKNSFFNFNDTIISGKDISIQNISYKNKNSNFYSYNTKKINKINNVSTGNKNSFNIFRKTKTKNLDNRTSEGYFNDEDLKSHCHNRTVNSNDILDEEK